MLTEKEIEDKEAWVRKYDEASEKRWRPADGIIGFTARSAWGSQSWSISRGAALGHI